MAAEVTGLSISSMNGNASPVISAIVRDSAGVSIVTGAEFFIDAMPGPEVRGKPLNAVDKAFDETSEDVSGYLTSAEVAAISEGSHTLYVRGFTQGGSVGEFTMVSFVKDRVNDPPVFNAFDTTPQVLKTRTVTFSAAATDDSTVLTYSLSGAPAWASIDSASGLVTLAPGFDTAPADYGFSVIVQDNGYRGQGKNPLQASIAVNVTVHSAGVIGNDLYVFGSSGDDQIVVSGGAATGVTIGSVARSILLGTAAESETSVMVALPPVGKIFVIAGNGTNLVRIEGPISASVMGGSGADYLRGGDGNDTLAGFAGADVLDGWAGDDLLDGGENDDWLVGGSGRNVVSGGLGADRLIQTGSVSFDLVAAAFASREKGLAAHLADAPSGDMDFVVRAGSMTGAVSGSARVIVDMPNGDIEFVDLVGGNGANRFAIDGWAGDGSFSAREGFDTLAINGTLGVVDNVTITDTHLSFGTVDFDISGFDNLETDRITAEDKLDVSGSSLKSFTNKGSDADIQIKLTGANFESLFNYGNQTNIRIDLAGADFGKFTSLVNAGSGVKIDIAGANFETLVNTGSNAIISIDVSGADFAAFTSLTNEGDGVKIDVSGAEFGSISNTGQGVVIDLSGADFGSLTNTGDGATIDISGADFGSISNTGQGVVIDLSGADFGSLTNTGDGATIDISGADFGSLANNGDGATIDISGADFVSLTNQGSDVTIRIDTSGADFGSFENLSNSGDRVVIDVSGASFDVILNTGDGVVIDASGADFDSLLSVTPEQFALIVAGADFGTIPGSSGNEVEIDLSGADFGSLVTGGDNSKIDLSGADFTTVVNLGSDVEIDASGANFDKLSGTDPEIDLSGANFGTLANFGDDALIDISGAVFSVIANYGNFVTIDAGVATGADFSGLSGPDPILDTRGANFGVLVNSGEGVVIDASGADFGSIVNQNGGKDVEIDVNGADFSSLVNSGSGVVIDASGAQFDSLRNLETGSFVTIDLSGADFGSLENLGSGFVIDASGADFDSLTSGPGTEGVVIDASGADFDSLVSSGDGLTIDAGGAKFDLVSISGNGSVHIFIQGGNESNTVVLAGIDLAGVHIEGGGGDDVFVILASASDIAVFGQGGDDRFVIGGIVGSNLVIDGGAGNDLYLFSGEVQAAIVLTESPDADADTLDFSSFTGGAVAIDLALTSVQNVAAGLSLRLSSGVGIENVTGTAWADTIRGNLRNNALRGADTFDDRMGPFAPSNGKVQIVVLDFDTFTNAESTQLDVPIAGAIDSTQSEEFVYSSESRSQVLAGIEAIYESFLTRNGGFLEFRTTAQGLDSGTYSTVYFNRSRFENPYTPEPGGDSSQVDFRNTSAAGWATVQINGLLGNAGQPIASTVNYVAASIWMGAHELGHLLGLRHSDSFGPIGFGINLPPGVSRYIPEYPGPAAAFETNSHVMATPAATGFTLENLISPTYFGERELVKLAYSGVVPSTTGVNGLLVAESGASQSGQAIALVPFAVPQSPWSGLNSNKQLAAAATTVVGYVSAAGQKDLYTFQGRAGDLVNIEVFSRGILADRYQDTLDTYVRVLKDGIVVAQFEGDAVNDDQFEFDSSIVDLYLPSDGTYTIEVSTFVGEGGISADNETGNYELFVYRFDTANAYDEVDSLEGRGGDDVLEGGMGDDRYVFSGANLGTDTIIEDLRIESGGMPNSTRDAHDILDFSGLGGMVHVDLALTTMQTIAPGLLSLKLSSALAFEDVVMSPSGGSALGNDRANTFYDGAGADRFDGRASNDLFMISGGADEVTGGEGDDVIRFLAAAAGSVVADGGSGVDTLDFSARTTGVTVNLGIAGSQMVGGGLTITMPRLDWENAYGSSSAENILTGNSKNNVLIGGSMRDSIAGGAGDDILIGLDGDDDLQGDDGYDILSGGLGADFLLGGNDEDLLISGRTEYDEIRYDSHGANVNLAYFDAVLSIWKNGTSASARKSTLRNPSTGLLRNGIVFDDSSSDRLVGANGIDLILVGTGDLVIEERKSNTGGDLKDPIQP
jgi:Ca2+-binding RTX toxin-like protein